MSAQVQAAKLVEALLEENLQEGIIIINNGGASSAEDDEEQAMAQLVGRVAQAPSKPGGPVRDQFSMDRKGKRWHFSIRRDEHGQISDIEVDETASNAES